MSKLSWSSPRAVVVLLAVVCALAFLLRLILVSLPSHIYDMGTFEAWAIGMERFGATAFYSRMWTDYLPLPLLGLQGIYRLATSLSLPYEQVQKTLVSSVDLLLIPLVYFLLKRKENPQNLLVTALLLFSPAFLLNAAVWGQVDNVPALLALLSLLLLGRVPAVVAGMGFGLAVAIKPIVILIGPILLLRARKFHQSIPFFLAAAFTFIVPGLLPVMDQVQSPLDLVRLPIQFLWKQTTYQSSVYPYTSVNAFNLWGLRDRGWDSDTSPVLGINARALGYVLFVLSLIPAFLHLKRKRFQLDLPDLAKLAAMVLLSFTMLTTRMHERHLLFGIPFLAIAALKETRLLNLFLLFTTTYTLNLYAALLWANNGQVFPFPDSVLSAIAVANVASLVLLMLSYIPQGISRFIGWFKTHRNLVLVLAIAAALRLVALSYPPTMIFDEVYHAFTAKEMLHGNPAAWEWWNTPPEGYAYEWTHPPLAKYGMVLGMLLLGENAAGWRVGSAIAGIFAVYLVYRLTYLWLKDEQAALLAAGLLALEGLHLVQSRVGMNDSYLVVFLLGSLVAATLRRWKPAALLYGLALASKWSALYGAVPLALLYWTSTKISFRSLLNFLRLGVVALLTYLVLYFPFFAAGHTLEQFVELHRQMWHYHTNLVATHAYQSRPWEWVVAARPVWYYVSYKEGSNANIYAQGNPLLYWLGLVAIGWALTQVRRKPVYLLLILSYLIFTVPWLFSPRIMFFYHYLPSAVFLCMILAAWLSHLPRVPRLGALALIVLAFIILSPVYYGIPAPHEYWNTLFALFPNWK